MQTRWPQADPHETTNPCPVCSLTERLESCASAISDVVCSSDASKDCRQHRPAGTHTYPRCLTPYNARDAAYVHQYIQQHTMPGIHQYIQQHTMPGMQHTNIRAYIQTSTPRAFYIDQVMHKYNHLLALHVLPEQLPSPPTVFMQSDRECADSICSFGKSVVGK